MNVGFDIISDLNLTGTEIFDWEGKPTSLFCLIPGNISSDITVVRKTLLHLRNFYQGVFFIDGYLENSDVIMKEERISELEQMCSMIKNVVYLHNSVAIVDGVALVGINGWGEDTNTFNTLNMLHSKANRYEDIMYLEKTIERLQLHKDVSRIVILSNCIPAPELYYGESYLHHDNLFPSNVLYTDTEDKIAKWVYGTTDKMVDTVIHGVNYVNNPKHDKNPYYPKRIDIEV